MAAEVKQVPRWWGGLQGNRDYPLVCLMPPRFGARLSSAVKVTGACGLQPVDAGNG